MASFAQQAAIRAKWSDLVETSFEVPGEVTASVRTVVGWLKQVLKLHFPLLYILSFRFCILHYFALDPCSDFSNSSL
jgi:hypothetical protein